MQCRQFIREHISRACTSQGRRHRTNINASGSLSLELQLCLDRPLPASRSPCRRSGWDALNDTLAEIGNDDWNANKEGDKQEPDPFLHKVRVKSPSG